MATLSRLARLFIPPVVPTLIRRFGAAKGGEFEIAASSIHSDVQGWNSERIVATEVRKFRKFAESVEAPAPLAMSHESDLASNFDLASHNIHLTFGYVLALTSRQRSSISILDWGGSLGHYYTLANSLVPDLKLDYHCLELPLMREAGETLNPGVHWCGDADNCLDRQYDLVILSGSLQCLEDWRATIRETSVCAGGSYLVARVPVVEGEGFDAAQDVYGVRTWHRVFGEGELRAAVEAGGLRLQREFLAERGPLIPGAHRPVTWKSYLYLRQVSA